jgi:hypothetical protein
MRLYLCLVPLLALGACASETVFCDCGEYGVGISVPADRFDDVANVTATGPGCASEVMTPQPHVFWVRGRAVGTCHIEITFRSGAPTFTADAQVEAHQTGCCSGFLADPVVVPELDGGAPSTADAAAGDAPLDAPAAGD